MLGGGDEDFFLPADLLLALLDPDLSLTFSFSAGASLLSFLFSFSAFLPAFFSRPRLLLLLESELDSLLLSELESELELELELESRL